MAPPLDLAAIASPANLATGWIGLNLFAFSAFGWDKAAAESGRRRVAESTLLFYALVGGTPGAYAGRKLFRHKTRKQPFSSDLHRIAIAQALLVCGWLGWTLAG